MNQKNKLAFLFLFIASLTFAQLHTYEYKRSIERPTDSWHKINIKPEMYKHLNQRLSDMRIYGVSKTDTTQVPFLMHSSTSKKVNRDLAFELINQTKNEDGIFFTFKLEDAQIINKIHLDFIETNFDWKIQLDASNDQKEWYTLLDDYRITSIKNKQVTYQYSQLHFEPSEYQYYRVLVKNIDKAELDRARLRRFEVEKGENISYPSTITKKETTNSNESLVFTQMDDTARISRVLINIKSNFDYYRPFKLEYLADSVKLDDGYRYQYATLITGVLDSSSDNTYTFPATTCKKLRLNIYNGNNEPLYVDSFNVSGFRDYLLARFTKEADFFLAYGKENDQLPSYDIEKFKDNIPEELTSLSLGEEILIIPNQPMVEEKGLFENKLWLWILMILAIAIMGGFTLKMLRSES
ncbi:DUF3999 domain-containing protein [Nonlabens sp. SCSIO 43208]|uniref:DUF3999 family protein n=1 Tax=Nonlabens sp. SCSIO 43208 TaxID=2793009 RepID=UPI003D6AC928